MMDRAVEPFYLRHNWGLILKRERKKKKKTDFKRQSLLESHQLARDRNVCKGLIFLTPAGSFVVFLFLFSECISPKIKIPNSTPG